jgi:hypothetical protein
MNTDIDLSEYTWEFVENINNGLCHKGSYKHGKNTGYEAAKAKWDARQCPCPIFDALELGYQCHRLAPFLFLNGTSFSSIIRSAVHAQIKISTVRRATLRSLAGHYVVGIISPEDKDTLSLLLNSIQTPLKVGDNVQTLKGNVKGCVTELLPDGNVLYKTPEGIEIKASPEALIKQPSTP